MAAPCWCRAIRSAPCVKAHHKPGELFLPPYRLRLRVSLAARPIPTSCTPRCPPPLPLPPAAGWLVTAAPGLVNLSSGVAPVTSISSRPPLPLAFVRTPSNRELLWDCFQKTDSTTQILSMDTRMRAQHWMPVLFAPPLMSVFTHTPSPRSLLPSCANPTPPCCSRLSGSGCLWRQPRPSRASHAVSSRACLLVAPLQQRPCHGAGGTGAAPPNAGGVCSVQAREGQPHGLCTFPAGASADRRATRRAGVRHAARGGHLPRAPRERRHAAAIRPPARRVQGRCVSRSF